MRNICYITVVILSVCFSSTLLAESYKLPTQQQVEKLVAAAWKTPPRSIDVTYYSTVKDKRKTEEMFRKIYTEHFDNEYGPDENLSPDMLERKEKEIQSNVDHRLAEQQQTKKIKYRVRYDGKSYRVDKVYGSPERTIRKGTAREELESEKILDANTPFETTDIETPVPTNGFEHYHYSHYRKTARVEKRKNSQIAVEKWNISSIVSTTDFVIFQSKLGTRNNKLAAEPYDINKPKIKQLCSGKLEGIRVEIRPDENEPDVKDIIEISLYNNEKIETYTSLMICAKDDYSKVYYYQIPNPATNNPPIFTKTCSDFDAQGIPHNITQVQYNSKREVILHETYQIEKICLNTPVAKEVFDFNPPKYYKVIYFRLPEAERQEVEIEGLKKWLKGEDRGRKIRAFLTLREYLKDNPDEIIRVAISMLEDENHDIRAMGLHTLIPLLKDNPEKLRNIATSMQDDEDRMVQYMVAKILKDIESKKEE